MSSKHARKSAFLCREYSLRNNTDEAPCNFILTGPPNLQLSVHESIVVEEVT